MSLVGFILSKSNLPHAHIARQAGCSEVLVRDILQPHTKPQPKPTPPRSPIGAKYKPDARERIWRTSLPGDVRRAIQAVADKHGVALSELICPSLRIGSQHMAEIRQEAYWAVYQIPERTGGRRYGTPRIGSFFGGRDHTTVRCGIQRHEARLAALRAPPATISGRAA